jgi:hypothetical protein
MRSFIGALLAGFLFIASARADDGCAKDVDCKGERICVQRQCVEPSALPPPAPDEHTVPASYQPAAPAIAPLSPRPSSLTALDTRHRHLGGFIRPDLGFGYHSMSASSNGTDVSISGFAGTFGFAAGGALSENSILAFHLWDNVVTNPTVSSGSSSVSTTDATLSLIAIGPEYTRYSASNVYFSITPSLTRATLTGNGTTSDTNWGFGLRAALGKEWWVGDHWGLGVVGHLSFSVNQDSGSNAPTWTSWGGTLAFSATYN